MLSVVIPTFDAAATLPATLAALGAVDELIVVDGGSRDRTVAIAAAGGARIVAAERGRGVQLAAGAAAARGEWLLFLHADTRLEPDWGIAVAAHRLTASGRPACFRLRLDDAAWQARVIERGVAARVRLLGLPYGDQGLLVSRAVYERAGGYRRLALMEDVDLVRRLPRVRTLDAAAITSAGRWRRDGWWRRSARNLLCLGMYGAGVPVAAIAWVYANPSS